MSKPKLTAIDRLADILEVVEMGRRTGMLAVERAAGTTREEGAVYFLSGRPIYAELGPIRGRDALSLLTQWGACRFAFDTSALSPVPNVTGALSATSTSDDGRRSPRSPAPASPAGQSGTWGESGVGWSFGGNGGYTNPVSNAGRYSSPGQGGPMQSPSTGSRLGGQGAGALGSGSLSGNGAGPASGWRGGAEESWGGFSGMPGGPGAGSSSGWPTSAGAFGRSSMPGPNSPHGAAYDEAVLARRPRRAPDERDLMSVVNAYQLSRSARAVLLLANGEYTVADLARLSARSVDEVRQVLADLEAQGLIYYYS